MGETPNEFRLDNPPEDGISSVKFGTSSGQFLLVTSWDTTVRLYDVVTNTLRVKYTGNEPVLDACFQVSKETRVRRKRRAIRPFCAVVVVVVAVAVTSAELTPIPTHTPNSSMDSQWPPGFPFETLEFLPGRPYGVMYVSS